MRLPEVVMTSRQALYAMIALVATGCFFGTLIGLAIVAKVV